MNIQRNGNYKREKNSRAITKGNNITKRIPER